MLDDESIRPLMIELRQRTSLDEIEWQASDDGFVYMGEAGGVRVASKDNDDRHPFELVLLDKAGSALDRYESQFELDNYGETEPTETTQALAALYQVAKNSALGIINVVQGLLSELRERDVPF